MENVKAISFEKREIGTMIKASKVQFRWRLQLDGQMTTIEVLSSKLSGKRRVFRDGVLIADKQQFEGAFTYQFHVMTYPMTIMQHGEHFELRINNVSFTHIHAQEQTKNQFVYEDYKNSAETGTTGAGGGVKSANPSFPFQTKSTGSSQPTTFDFNQPAGGAQPSISGVTSMSGGGPRVPTTGKRKPAPKKPIRGVTSGWDDVAAAKNEVFKDSQDDDEPATSFSRPLPQQTQQQQATSFDFNSYQTPEQEKRAEPMRGGGNPPASSAGPSFTVNQYKAGIKFGGFQRQDMPAGFQRQQKTYDSYGDSPASKNTKAPSQSKPEYKGEQNFFDFNVTEEKQEVGNLLDVEPAKHGGAESASFDFGAVQVQPAAAAAAFSFQFENGSQQQVSNDLLGIDSGEKPQAVTPLDILQGGSGAAEQLPAQANLDDLLTSAQVSGEKTTSDTVAALQDLNLGGKTAEEAVAEQEALKRQEEEKAAAAAEEAKKAEEAEAEAMPISRKDAALNSLVNFENLKVEKKNENEGEAPDYKPLIIKPGVAATSGFIPQPLPAAQAEPIAAIEQSEAPKAITFQPQADILDIAKKESATFASTTTPAQPSRQSNSSAAAGATFDFGGSQPSAPVTEQAAAQPQSNNFDFNF